MGKNMEYSFLLDFYGGMLTEKQRGVMEQYYNDDLSLAEIADNFGITRQGVRDAIKHGEAVLDELEQQVGMVRRSRTMQKQLATAETLAKRLLYGSTDGSLSNFQVSRIAQEILDTLAKMEEQEEPNDGV